MSFVHPQDQHIRHALTSPDLGGQGELFFRIVCRDGSLKLVSLIGLEHDGDDRRLCLLDYSSNIASMPDVVSARVEAPEGHPYAPWSLYDESADLTLSPSSRVIFGLGAGERLNLSHLLRRIPPADRDAVAAGFALGESSRVTCQFARIDDGAERTIAITFFACEDSVRHQFGRWGTVLDITKQTERERQLAAEERLRDAYFESATEGVLLLGRDGTVRRINGEARRLLHDVAPGTNLWECVPALISDAIWRDAKQVGETGRAATDERYVPALNHWLHLSLRPVGDDILVVLRDRDEIYGLEARFHEFTSRCDAAFTLGKIGLWEYDQQSDLIWFAQSAPALVGSRTMSFTEFMTRVSPEDAAAIRVVRHRAMIDGTPFDLAFTVTSLDGTVRKVRSRGGLKRGGLTSGRKLAGILIELPDAETPGPAEITDPESDAGHQLLTGVQVRAARGALRWSVRELAEHSDVSVATINRFEADSRLVNTRDTSIVALYHVLRRHGITFFVDGRGRPGIVVGVDEPA